MANISYDINQLENLGLYVDGDFPHAPLGWSRMEAEELARAEGLKMTELHWMALRALQDFYAHQEGEHVNLRELHDALDERFHHQGGIRRLYGLFPGGPVAQGCRLAGLKPPTHARDMSFGSVA